RLAAQVEREPRLVDAGVTSDAERLDAIWTLMWGSIRSRDFARAEHRWQEVSVEVFRCNPVLGKALQAFLAARGHPEGDAVVADIETVVASLTAQECARLGYDRGQCQPSSLRAILPPPASVVAVEQAVLAACGGETWPRFVEIVESWSGKVVPPIRRAIRVLAGALAVREALLRVTSAAARPLESMRLLAKCVEREQAPPELAGDALLALRLVLSRIPGSGPRTEEEAEACAAVVEAAACYPEHRRVVVDSVTSWQPTKEMGGAVLSMIRSLARLQPCAALAAKALVVLGIKTRQDAGERGRAVDEAEWDEEDEIDTASEWIAPLVRSVLRDDKSLETWLINAGDIEAIELAFSAGACLPADLIEEMVARTWDDASEFLRVRLTSMVRATIDRGCDDGFMERFVDGIKFGLEPDEAISVAMEDRTRASVPAPAIQRLWQRVGDRVLPYCPELLTVAFQNAKTPAQVAAAAERCLSGQANAMAYMKVMRIAGAFSHMDICLDVKLRFFKTFAGNVEELARALHVLWKEEAPVSFCREVACALVDAAALHSGGHSPHAEQMIVLARAIDGRRHAKKPRAKKPAATKTPARRKSEKTQTSSASSAKSAKSGAGSARARTTRSATSATSATGATGAAGAEKKASRGRARKTTGGASPTTSETSPTNQTSPTTSPTTKRRSSRSRAVPDMAGESSGASDALIPATPRAPAPALGSSGDSACPKDSQQQLSLFESSQASARLDG
ncbi:MAG: DUF6109 family natural product biosynthesis protein, partial [Pseudomonadota bacterium]